MHTLLPHWRPATLALAGGLLIGGIEPLGLLVPSAYAQEATQPKPSPKARRLKAPKPPAPTSETRAERDQRLLRECQGRPNAGACEGYAR